MKDQPKTAKPFSCSSLLLSGWHIQLPPAGNRWNIRILPIPLRYVRLKSRLKTALLGLVFPFGVDKVDFGRWVEVNARNCWELLTWRSCKSNEKWLWAWRIGLPWNWSYLSSALGPIIHFACLDCTFWFYQCYSWRFMAILKKTSSPPLPTDPLPLPSRRALPSDEDWGSSQDQKDFDIGGWPETRRKELHVF